LNFTVDPLPKPVPVIVTDDPTAPLAGEKPVTVGAADTTLKLPTSNDFVPGPLFSTRIGPVVAPGGTVAVIEVLVSALMLATVPWNSTVAPGRKPVPLIVTDVPTGPNAGEKPVTVTVGAAGTVKLKLLVARFPARVVTEIGPVVAPIGTVAVTEVLLVTVVPLARVPLNLTVDPARKPVPVIVTDVPTAPLAGAKLVRVTVGTETMKLVPSATF
jgi:hypothetical protein